MRYEIIVTPSAKADIFETNTWQLEKDPVTAEKWLWQLSTAITSLREFPARFSVTEESAVFDVEVRQLLFGKRPYLYRILYSIDREQVFVLRVRSTRRRRLIDEAEDSE